MLRSTRSRLFVVPLAVLAAAACESTAPDQVLDATLIGNETFQGAHGGQPIAVAVVRSSDGAVVASAEGTVSATENPAFSFTFPNALERGVNYGIHYWIDSNFDGGTEGECDPPAIDHQWRIGLGVVFGNVTVTESHRPAETEDVCASF